MTRWAIVDTGPLVAFLDRREPHHVWVANQFRQLAAPLLTCEPVLTEALFLLAERPKAQNALFSMLENGALRIAFQLAEHLTEVRVLCHKYRDRPMSLADACLVRMAEIHQRHTIFTLDSDFVVYRKHGRMALALIAPSQK